MIYAISVSDDYTYCVKTSHGTEYVIDITNMRGKRIPAPDRNTLRADNMWFSIKEIFCTVGYPMSMLCTGIAQGGTYTWRLTTPVTDILVLSEEKINTV